MPYRTREEYLEYQAEVNLRKSFADYGRRYDKKAAIIESSMRRNGEYIPEGITAESDPEYFMHAPKIKNLDEYATRYEATKSDIKEEIEKGVRKGDKGIGNIAQYIVSKQGYPVSYKTALIIKRSSKRNEEEWGTEARKVSIQDIMRRSPKAKEVIFSSLKEVYEELRNKGYSGKEAKAEIAINWFNSDPKKYGR